MYGGSSGSRSILKRKKSLCCLLVRCAVHVRACSVRARVCVCADSQWTPEERLHRWKGELGRLSVKRRASLNIIDADLKKAQRVVKQQEEAIRTATTELHESEQVLQRGERDTERLQREMARAKTSSLRHREYRRPRSTMPPRAKRPRAL